MSTPTLPRLDSLSTDAEPYLSLGEAAALGYPGAHTLRRLIHSGELPAKTFGKAFVVKRSDLEALGQSVKPADVTATANAAEFDDLARVAARLVASWPALSDERKQELGQLLSTAA